MKFSYNWLKEISGTKKTAQEIADLFLTHSFEVEEIIDLGKNLENVVVGEVLSVEKHSDADKLNVAKVNVGNEKLQIVCGASNLEVGQKVPVALIGAKLPMPENKETIKFFEIKKAKLRGIESSGMICAEDELELGENHDGIMVLAENAEVGQSLAEYLQLNDFVFDIDILPNRGHDCLSYNGIAREIVTLDQNIDLKDWQEKNVENDIFSDKKGDSLNISIDTENCNRYIGTKISGVKIGEAPEWMKVRLKASGMNSINNIVDITNYVMLETGQPLHAFDTNKVEKISVRQAKNKEKIMLLDDDEIELIEDDIVITDGKNPIALAGVMGGKDSGIADETTDIILESANFNSSSIRFTQRRYNLQTDAAYRFERDIDPNFTEQATVRAIELIQELCGGKVEIVKDNYNKKIKPWTVQLSGEYVRKLLGTDISSEKIVNILERLGIGTDGKAGEEKISCIIPTRRRDLRGQEDLIEEIGRVYGYDKIKPIPIVGNVELPYRNEQRFFERALKDICVGSGFSEIKGYSFYGKDQAEAIGLGEKKHLALLNPFNVEQDFLRRTLAVHLLSADKKNLSYFDQVNIFEIGRIYNPTENSLPDEKLVFGASVASKNKKGEQFFELKGLLEVLFERVGLNDFYFDDSLDETEQYLIPSLHPSRQAVIKIADGKVLGWIGEMSRNSHKHFGLKKVKVSVCEIDIDNLLAETEKERFFEPLAKFPFVNRDLSMIVGEEVRVGDVERVIYMAGGDLVKDVDLFDLYVNAESSERSMAFRITFGNVERTLKSEEVDERIIKIIESVEEKLGVEVRK
ncbi:MAG: phenylalanine--tRNA ligase subunit beta [Candidatus Moranbacteria bacterium]|nr:phenylalanine--tRNA ligase subunit beta [Candidatus Moranbacteria bacterium]